jgi:hypothetical protein
LGRPLPYGTPGEPTMPEDASLSDEDALLLAQQLLDAGRPFHAHEVLEAQWKACRDPDLRDVWQGLAQIAVGLTHEARGNAAGAAALIRRGRDRVAGAAAAPPGVDAARVVRWADGRLADGTHERLRLTGGAGPAP